MTRGQTVRLALTPPTTAMTYPTRTTAEPADRWPHGPDERPFTPPPSGGLPWLAVLLTLAGTGLIGVSVLGPQASAEALRSAGTSLVAAVQTAIQPEDTRIQDLQAPPDPPATAESGAPAGPEAAAVADVPEDPPARPAARRCVRNGHTTFTDGPCPGGVSGEALDLAIAAPAADAPGTLTLYRCRSHDGGYFWTRTHCHRQGARIDRMTEVPAGLSLAQQTRLAEQRRLEARALTNPAPAPRVRVAQGSAGGGAPSRCEWLEQQIAHIDSQARRPLPGPRQDQLRTERRTLRDEQFSLRCP